MTLHHRAAIGSAVLALALVAPSARAHVHESRAANPNEEATSSAARAEPLKVDDEIAFDLSSRCRVHARVAGTIEPVSVMQRTYWKPDVVVTTKLVCPKATSTVTLKESGNTYSPEELARTLSGYAAFHRTDGWQRCSITPSVKFDGRRLAFGSVRFICRPFATVPI